MRAGLGYDSDKSGKKYHQGSVAADPLVKVNVLHSYAENQQDSECPCEYGREMSLHDMVPEMSFDKMV